LPRIFSVRTPNVLVTNTTAAALCFLKLLTTGSPSYICPVISQNTIQQILSRIDIIDIVGTFVKLKKRGTNYLGLCPFHNEKSPSFTVSPTKEIYKCFGCGKSGNSISFLMEHEKYSYVESLRWLANRYNVEVEETEVSEEVKLQQQVADSLYVINNFAQKYFSEKLMDDQRGRDIGLAYLKERGFREDIIQKFQIGYCLEERDAFARTAIANQFNRELLQRSGLVVERDETLYDNYRGRIIFPVHNQSGKILGFGARIIAKNDRAPKYINTPENEVYVKSKILYGSYFARQAIDKADECLLVEGYTDVVSLHQAGIENVVASGGTSLTPDQLRLVHKYTTNLTIIYDGDSAGIKAALRGLDLALEEGLNVQLVLIPDKEDPDSYVNKVGPEKFKEFIRTNKKDFIIFQLEVGLKDAGNDSSKKSGLVNQVAETIARINKLEDFTKQQDYIRQCAELLHIEETGLTNLVNKYLRDKFNKQEIATQKKLDSDAAAAVEAPNDLDEINRLFEKDASNEKGLVRCLLEFGLKPWNDTTRVADYIIQEINEQQLLEIEYLNRIVDLYKTWYAEGLEPGPKNFLYHEDQELNKQVLNILDFPYELSPNWSEHFEGKIFTREELFHEEIVSTMDYLKLRKIRKMIEENQKDLQQPHEIDQQMVLLQTHHHLKTLERELLKRAGTVIVK
jgi:DNA primase